MKKPNTFVVFIVALALGLSSLACQFGGAATAPTATSEAAVEVVDVEPTATTQPDPTAEPTKVPTTVPTEIPTEVPTSEPAVTEPPQTSEGCVAGELVISYIDAYIDEYGSWNVLGKVCNSTGSAVTNLEIIVEVFDPSGASVYTETAWPSLYNIADGAETPFTLSIYEEVPACTGNVDCTVSAEVTSYDDSDAEMVELELQNHTTFMDEYGVIYIAGELVNTTDEPVNLVGLAVSVSDTEGNLVAVESFATTLSYLTPGYAAPFRFTVLSTKGNITEAEMGEFTLYMDAITFFEQELIVDPENDISDLTYFYDLWDSFHMVGAFTNSHTENLNPRFVVAIYNADGQVLDVAYTDAPITSIAPGETIPVTFDFWGAMDAIPGLIDQADNYKVTVDPYWTWESSTEMFTLTTSGDTNEFDGSQGVFNGQVVNNSGGDIQSAIVIVSLYDAEDNLVSMAYRVADISEVLADGGTANYDVFVPIPEGTSLSDYTYEIIVKGTRPY